MLECLTPDDALHEQLSFSLERVSQPAPTITAEGPLGTLPRQRRRPVSVFPMFRDEEA